MADTQCAVAEHTKESSASAVRQPKILFTSVCRPIGPSEGDAQSVGYELLHGQVTRAQGIFSPRATHHTYGLDFIAENLKTPAVVLHYPTKEELARELRTGQYDYVGVSFILATYHKMKELSAIVRKNAPKAKLILGGYGTVLPDEKLTPYGDIICRGEGVAFMRNLLGEPHDPEIPFKHPVMESRLRVFSNQVSSTGMIFAGLGCPNGCDFCCTSHYFKRQHIKLLRTGKDIYDVVRRYLDRNPNSQFTILDEDFLLDKKRAGEFREEVLKGGVPVSIFAFASVKALSMYTIEELLETGIDGVWIGYEGTRSNYSKQQGKPVDQLFQELRSSGVTILASMIVGLPYQNKEIIAGELAGLIKLKPALTQFLIYNPTPGTPLYQQTVEKDMFRKEFKENPERTYHGSTGFVSMIEHPALGKAELEAVQANCFDQEYKLLGPSIYRTLEVYYNGYMKYRGSTNPFLRKKAEQWGKDVRRFYPIFLVGQLFATNASVRRQLNELQEKVYAELGRPTLGERTMSFFGLLAASWTWFTLKTGINQHPSLTRHTYRCH